MTEEEISTLKSIEKAHVDVHRALLNKDIDSYLAVFSESVKYTQPDGKTISKSALRTSTKAYFNRIHSVDHHVHQDKYSIENGICVEHLSQDTSVYIRAFVLFLVKWNVKRKGIYTWRFENGSWKIISVKVLQEKTKLERGLWLFTKNRPGLRTD